MKSYKLDRSAFKMQTAVKASNNYCFWKNQSFAQRLEAAFYLNSVAYNFDISNPPGIDKTFFQIRTRK